MRKIPRLSEVFVTRHGMGPLYWRELCGDPPDDVASDLDALHEVVPVPADGDLRAWITDAAERGLMPPDAAERALRFVGEYLRESAGPGHEFRDEFVAEIWRSLQAGDVERAWREFLSLVERKRGLATWRSRLARLVRELQSTDGTERERAEAALAATLTKMDVQAWEKDRDDAMTA